MVDVGGGVTNVAVVVPVSGAGRVVEGKAEFLEEWIAARPSIAERFVGAERIDAVRATGPFASAAKKAWAPGAALVGDAADFYDPFTGEGIYTALRGGELLAPFVAESLRPGAPAERALAAYDAARIEQFSGKWKVERLVGMAVAYPAMMNRMAGVLSRRKDMADLLVGVAGDFVPPRAVLNPKFLLTLFFSTVRG
jgi:flavin-dependent dehydrogenase